MNRQSNPTIIAIQGFPVKITDVWGIMADEKSRTVLLANGMKLSVTSEERDMLQRALNNEAKRIVKESRERGTL